MASLAVSYSSHRLIRQFIVMPLVQYVDGGGTAWRLIECTLPSAISRVAGPLRRQRR